MSWSFLDNRPIYIQLLERLKQGIVSGAYLPGSKLPSVRELAAEAGVNPNTIQHAYGQLEQEQLIYTQRTSGKFVTEDLDVIESVRTQLAAQQIRCFLESMQALGYDGEQALGLLQENMKEE